MVRNKANAYNLYLCIGLVILFLTSCTSRKPLDDHGSTCGLVHLLDSTRIIRALITQNKLSDLLVDHDPEQLDVLLNNVSPAQMAFEVEVLSSTVPVVFVYYYKDSPEEQAFIRLLNALAVEYDERVKFVVVDVDKLFVLAEGAAIETYPATIVVQQRDIIETIPGTVTIDEIKQRIRALANQ